MAILKKKYLKIFISKRLSIMKKILGLILLLSCIVFSGVPPTSSNAMVLYEKIMKLAATTIWDTLVGADSAEICTYTTFDKKYYYFMSSGPWLGDSVANAVIQVIVKSYDENNVLIKRAIVDTIDIVNGDYSDLKIHNGCYGTKFKILIKDVNANDEAVPSATGFIINRYKIVLGLHD
jgi:hypothetical protein